MEGEVIRQHPTVVTLAKQQVPWAVKLLRSGWSSLSTKQKANARAATGRPTATPLVIVPKRPRVRNPVNRMTNGQGGKSMTITRSEFLSIVVGAAGQLPAMTSWVVNPRNVGTFPQTSMLALNFNKYRVARLAVNYSPACSFETNGRVTIGWNDDASDPMPKSKLQLYELSKHAETAVQTPVKMEIPMDNKVRFLRDSASDDPKLVDLGRITLATYGFNNSSDVVGELFLEYTIVFSDPTFTTQFSQEWTAESGATGPEYVTTDIVTTPAVEGTAAVTTFNMRFLAPGKWRVCLIGRQTGTLGGIVFHGEGTTGNAQLLQDTSAVATGVVETQVAGGYISTQVLTPGVTRWVVSRF